MLSLHVCVGDGFQEIRTLYSSNRHTALNKTVGIPQKIPTIVNQSLQALYGELCDLKMNGVYRIVNAQ